MMIHNKSIICILCMIFLYSTEAFSDRLNCPCKVVKITDGDTIHVLDQSGGALFLVVLYQNFRYVLDQTIGAN